MAGLSLIVSITLVVLCVFVKKHSRWAYFLTLAILGTLALLTLTDNFGVSDLVYLVLTVIPLALLVHIRKWYFDPASDPKS